MNYRTALPPRQHQAAARHKMTKSAARNNADVFALLMDMGTGKSKVIVDEFGERAAADDVSDLLLFAPAGCYRNWNEDRANSDPSEFTKHMDPAFRERLVAQSWISGGGVSRRLRLQALLRTTDRPRALIINCEAMSRVTEAQEACEELVRTSRRGVIVAVDESPTIKNIDSLRSKAINQIGEMDRIAAKRIMSGLVTPNSPLDLFAQFSFLDWRILGFRSFVGFRARYAHMRDMEVGVQGVEFEYGGERKLYRRTRKIVTGFKHVEELHDKIDDYSFRVLKDECLDLPKKIYLPVREVELTAEQKRIYRDIKENATAQLAAEAWVTVTMVLTQRLRLDQVLCGFTMDEAGALHEIPENRTAELIELLGDYEGKALIWTTHDHCIHKITARLRKEFGPRSVAQFWGGNRKTRDQDEARFKGDQATRFMVATQSAGGMGNTWVQAGLSVYYNNSDNLEHRLQSEDRNHRDGLTGPTGAGHAIYADLVAPGTIDVKKIRNLRNKINLASLVTGDNYREWLI